MEKAYTTTSTGFLDNLWPQLLNQIECDAQNSDASEYFIPERKFDYKWATELLASQGFKDYNSATEVQRQETTLATEEDIEQLPYRDTGCNILPLDQQLAIRQHDVNMRKKLAHDFANRTFPWYIQRPAFPFDFPITDELKKIFKNNLELEILQKIQRFRCNLMVIDVAASVPLKNLEPWHKFSSYASIVTVIHDKELLEILETADGDFKPVFMQELTQRSWQEELQRSINIGKTKAKELFLLDDTNSPIVFVFSHSRNICVCNRFAIIKKF